MSGTGRTLIIGDVHGCADELDALLKKLGVGARDDVVFVGDLVNKGPDSAGVVARARELGARAVMGNHDASFLEKRTRSPKDLKPGQREVLESLGAKDWAYLEALPGFLRLPKLGVIVVHGGVVPGKKPEDMSVDLLSTLRSITPEGEPSKRSDDGVPWASLWKGPDFVVFGHDAKRGLQKHAHAVGLDSGCVYGGELTAYVLPEKKLVSVKAKKAYVEL